MHFDESVKVYTPIKTTDFLLLRLVNKAVAAEIESCFISNHFEPFISSGLNGLSFIENFTFCITTTLQTVVLATIIRNHENEVGVVF